MIWNIFRDMRKLNCVEIRDEDPDPVLFSTDPDSDPTCNNGFIKLFLSWTKYKSESTNSSIKWWVIISNFIPTYLKCKYIFFFISISGRIRIRNFFSAEPDPDPWKKIPDPHPWFMLPVFKIVIRAGFYRLIVLNDKISILLCTKKYG